VIFGDKSRSFDRSSSTGSRKGHRAGDPCGQLPNPPQCVISSVLHRPGHPNYYPKSSKPTAATSSDCAWPIRAAAACSSICAAHPPNIRNCLRPLPGKSPCSPACFIVPFHRPVRPRWPTASQSFLTALNRDTAARIGITPAAGLRCGPWCPSHHGPMSVLAELENGERLKVNIVDLSHQPYRARC